MPTISFVKIVDGYPVLDIGKLRHPCTILAQTQPSPPEFGPSGAETIWAPFLDPILGVFLTGETAVMMGIEPVSGQDVIRGGQTTTELHLTLACWYASCPSVLPEMRVQTENDSVYVIESVENILHMNAVWQLNCLGLGPND